MNIDVIQNDKNKMKAQNKRLIKAKKNFRKLQEKIAPFIRSRRFKIYSTTGKWNETNSLLRADKQNSEKKHSSLLVYRRM